MVEKVLWPDMESWFKVRTGLEKEGKTCFWAFLPLFELQVLLPTPENSLSMDFSFRAIHITAVIRIARNGISWLYWVSFHNPSSLRSSQSAGIPYAIWCPSAMLGLSVLPWDRRRHKSDHQHKDHSPNPTFQMLQSKDVEQILICLPFYHTFTYFLPPELQRAGTLP